MSLAAATDDAARNCDRVGASRGLGAIGKTVDARQRQRGEATEIGGVVNELRKHNPQQISFSTQSGNGFASSVFKEFHDGALSPGMPEADAPDNPVYMLFLSVWMCSTAAPAAVSSACRNRIEFAPVGDGNEIASFEFLNVSRMCPQLQHHPNFAIRSMASIEKAVANTPNVRSNQFMNPHVNEHNPFRAQEFRTIRFTQIRGSTVQIKTNNRTRQGGSWMPWRCRRKTAQAEAGAHDEGREGGEDTIEEKTGVRAPCSVAGADQQACHAIVSDVTLLSCHFTDTWMRTGRVTSTELHRYMASLSLGLRVHGTPSALAMGSWPFRLLQCQPNPVERPMTQAILQILTGAALPPDVPLLKPAFMWPAMPVALEDEDDYDDHETTTSRSGMLLTDRAKHVTSPCLVL
uniref:Uncharacterized protein n=1 Tax=Oryza brachyantha TaxID=4533 RepID=J3LGE6_ORYBR